MIWILNWFNLPIYRHTHFYYVTFPSPEPRFIVVIMTLLLGLPCFTLTDDNSFVSSFIRRQDSRSNQRKTETLTSLSHLTWAELNWHAFKDYWVKKRLIRLLKSSGELWCSRRDNRSSHGGQTQASPVRRSVAAQKYLGLDKKYLPEKIFSSGYWRAVLREDAWLPRAHKSPVSGRDI